MAKILFIVPIENLRIVASKTIEEYRNYYDPILGEKEDLQIEVLGPLNVDEIDIYMHNPDIIVARGLTALNLKKHYPDIPIVEIPVTTMDVVSAVMSLQRENIHNEPIVFTGFGNILYQADTASKLCHIPIVPYDFYSDNFNDTKCSMILDDISSKGFKYIIGGVRVVNMANKRNLVATFLQCGQESIWIAIGEALHIIGARRRESERAARFETILNHSQEGIISTDMNNKIIHINSSAGKILDIDISECIGSGLEKIIPDSKFIRMLNDEKEYSDEIFKTQNGSIVLNKVATSLRNEIIGNVLTFQNINNVQNTEIKIRSKLYHKGLVAKYSFTDIIGESISLKETIKKAKAFAKFPSNVLIIGDTGTGKELFSQSIHNHSNRKKGPFVAVNCAAIPENLMESEFFGYAGGAFTGASKDGKAGFFELAHEGTIFLDEVSELPLNLQGKLLRVIQESEVMRIGHDKIIPINIRIICACNKNLKLLVKEGKFRKDLYYRLCVLQLQLPSLRDRGQDILLLANNFISQYTSTFGKNSTILSSDAQKLLLSYLWDGNIRELRNVCEQLVALNETGTISSQEVNTILSMDDNEEIKDHIISALPLSNNLPEEKKQLEKNLIIQALKECKYNKTKAAELLCMNRSTLWRKLKEYNIEH